MIDLCDSLDIGLVLLPSHTLHALLPTSQIILSSASYIIATCTFKTWAHKDRFRRNFQPGLKPGATVENTGKGHWKDWNVSIKCQGDT